VSADILNIAGGDSPSNKAAFKIMEEVGWFSKK